LLVAVCAGIVSLTSATSAQGFSDGVIYTSSNESAGNRVLIFTRAADGTASFAGDVATGGRGTDGGLGNQGAVTLSSDQSYLYVVNAGSDTLSVFEAGERTLDLLQVVDTRGEQPVSVAQHDDVVYVLNAGNDVVAGFRQRDDGTLRAIPGRRRLSGTDTAAAQLAFSDTGDFLYVTERATNAISRFAVSDSGTLGTRLTLRSAGTTPFGFVVGPRRQLIVSEAAGGEAGASSVSSYAADASDGALSAVTAALPNGQSGACWAAATPDGRLVFVSNTGSDSVSSFAVDFDGTLTLLNAQAALTDDGPIDVALSSDGLFFYVLNSGDGTLGDYRVGADGSLSGIAGVVDGLPASSTGLAVR